jgi:hypothetical protein
MHPAMCDTQRTGLREAHLLYWPVDHRTLRSAVPVYRVTCLLLQYEIKTFWRAKSVFSLLFSTDNQQTIEG